MNEQTPFLERRSPHQYPCQKHEAAIGVLSQRDDSLQKTLDGVSTKLDLILAQITKVAVLEEKHANQALDVSRAHDKIGKLEDTLEDLAKETREFIAYTRGQGKLLWAIGGAVGALGVKVLFFTSALGMTP